MTVICASKFYLKCKTILYSIYIFKIFSLGLKIFSSQSCLNYSSTSFKYINTISITQGKRNTYLFSNYQKFFNNL